MIAIPKKSVTFISTRFFISLLKIYNNLYKIEEKIIKVEYFIHNDEIFPTYFILEENLKKYKRRKLGNPDVLKFVQYQKEHPEVTSYENHYDIKYFAQLVDI